VRLLELGNAILIRVPNTTLIPVTPATPAAR